MIADDSPQEKQCLWLSSVSTTGSAVGNGSSAGVLAVRGLGSEEMSQMFIGRTLFDF